MTRWKLAAASALAMLAAGGVGAPALAAAAAPGVTLRDFGLDRSGVGDLTWRSARRTGNTLELRDVRSGDARMARALVTLDGEAVRRIRFEDVRLESEGLSLGAVDLFEPTPALLQAGASAFVALDPLGRPAPGPVGAARLRIEGIEAKDEAGAFAVEMAEFSGFALTADAVDFQTLDLAGLRFTAPDANATLAVDLIRLAGPTATMRKLMGEGSPVGALAQLAPAPAPAGAAPKALKSSDFAWFHDVTFTGLRLESKLPSSQPTPERIEGGVAAAPAPASQRLSLSAASFRVEGFAQGEVDLIEVKGLSGRLIGRLGQPEGSFTFEGLTIRDLAVDYYLATIEQSLRAAGRAVAGRAAAGAAATAGATAAAAPLPALPGGPLDPGFSAFSLGAIEAEAQGARLSIGPLRYEFARAPDGYVTAISSAPWAFALRAERTTGQNAAFGSALATALAEIGYPEGVSFRLLPGAAAMDRARDEVSVRDAGFDWTNGLSLSIQLRLAQAAAVLAASRNPRSAADLTALTGAARLAGFGLDVRDLGGLSRIAALAARRDGAGKTPSAIRAQWAAQVEALGKASGVEQTLLQGFARWLREGGGLVVTAAPSAPVPVDTLGSEGKGWKQLNLRVENKP